MTINEQAIRAALEKLAPLLKPEVIYPCMGGAMQDVASALEAAMPHIRKQIADEIRNAAPLFSQTTEHGKATRNALAHAAEIVEGKP